jgi:hypothetical protein
MAGGPAHTCVADPNVTLCPDGDPSVCPAAAPACVGGICVECDDDTDCADPTVPKCDLDLHRCGDCDSDDQCTRFDMTCGPAGACVECTPTDPPTQDPTCTDAAASVCGANGMCRGCQDHRECDSGACDLQSGMCVDPTDIAYVDHDASGGNTTCTAAAKCSSIIKGLATNKPYVVLDGDTYQEDLILTGRNVALIGYGADTTAQTNGADALVVTGNSGQVSVYGLTLRDSARGVSCAGSTVGSTAVVLLVDATVSGNTQSGIDVTQCNVQVQQSRITGNTGGSGGAGIYIHGGGFDVTDDVIDDNGALGLYGGVRIDEPRATPQILHFNTITNNHSGASGFPGIACSSSVAVDPFESNIVDGNTGATGGVQVQSGGACGYDYSLINPAPAGTQNVEGDPMLDATFHIASGSPARDVGNATGAPAQDFEHQLRTDGMPDIGADEFGTP